MNDIQPHKVLKDLKILTTNINITHFDISCFDEEGEDKVYVSKIYIDMTEEFYLSSGDYYLYFDYLHKIYNNLNSNTHVIEVHQILEQGFRVYVDDKGEFVHFPFMFPNAYNHEKYLENFEENFKNRGGSGPIPEELIPDYVKTKEHEDN